jgi:archaemetzincin
MKIGVIGIGQIQPTILEDTSHGITQAFPDSLCEVIDDMLTVPEPAYDKKRGQYNSTMMLNDIREFTNHRTDYNRILGIIDADVFSSELTYVFGEAYMAGKVGLVSLWRLKPEFYSEKHDSRLFQIRTLKEAIHELGHTLSLQNCPRSYCVMHFSNSIFEVDKKQTLFCDQCYLNASLAITQIGKKYDAIPATYRATTKTSS